tara:strand:+ start:222 stop:575 length:354 start_codon:yes stop_codon:yes gene_type:complete
MGKATVHKKCQLLVNHFCGHAPKILWGKEIKIAQKLLKINSDVKFWLSVQTQEPIFSLSFFLTDEGKDLLRNLELRKNLNLRPKDNAGILEGKLGQDKKLKKKKPKNLMDFLNDGKD